MSRTKRKSNSTQIQGQLQHQIEARIEKTEAFSGYLPPQAWNKITIDQIGKMITGHFKHLQNTDINISKQLDNQSKKIDNDTKIIMNERIYMVLITLLSGGSMWLLSEKITNTWITYIVGSLVLVMIFRSPIVALMNAIIHKTLNKE